MPEHKIEIPNEKLILTEIGIPLTGSMSMGFAVGFYEWLSRVDE